MTTAALVGAVVGARALTDSAPTPPVTATDPAAGGDVAGGTSSASRMVGYDLKSLVATSPRIVVGTVGEVQHRPASDASGGLDYLLATLRVQETIRGAEAAEVVTFDYEYGGVVTPSEAIGASIETGDRVLVFLSDVAGTVHEGILPAHRQVTGGAQGAYAMEGDEPAASFTLADVRAEVAQQGRADRRGADLRRLPPVRRSRPRWTPRTSSSGGAPRAGRRRGWGSSRAWP